MSHPYLRRPPSHGTQRATQGRDGASQLQPAALGQSVLAGGSSSAMPSSGASAAGARAYQSIPTGLAGATLPLSAGDNALTVVARQGEDDVAREQVMVHNR